MSKFIELGQRFGLEPWQLGIEYDASTGETYITGTPAGFEANQSFRKMMTAMGVSVDDEVWKFPHEEGREMLSALDLALQNAPRKRVR